jgi:hypothetical protein
MTKGGHMTKLVIGIAAFVLLAAGGALAGGAITDSSPDDPATTGISTTNGTTTNDTTTTNETTTTNRTTTLGETGEDVSGPCDEAEHANDPRCAGDDGGHGDRPRRNRGHDDDGRNGDSGENRSGSNSGRG